MTRLAAVALILLAAVAAATAKDDDNDGDDYPQPPVRGVDRVRAKYPSQARGVLANKHSTEVNLLLHLRLYEHSH
jgi:hypothetical protein